MSIVLYSTRENPGSVGSRFPGDAGHPMVALDSWAGAVIQDLWETLRLLHSGPVFIAIVKVLDLR